MITKPFRAKLSSIVLVALLLGSLLAQAEPNREQILQMRAGWNAILLEVEPEENEPNTVFSGTPVDIVARYFSTSPAVQFITDPGEAPWKEPGWGVWYGATRPDAFLSTLYAIQGNVAYLVHCTSDYTWRITGKASLGRQTWKTESFNLVGFTLDNQNPPSFAQFFAGSKGLIGKEVFRLLEGKWTLVSNPAGTFMRSGEAYWVSCDGQTDYQGPLEVQAPGIDELDFGTFATELEFKVRNSSPKAASIRVETVQRSQGMRLQQVLRKPDSPSRTYAELPTMLDLPSIPAGESRTVRLRVRRDQLGSDLQSALLRISSTEGGEKWLPVQAQNPEAASN